MLLNTQIMRWEGGGVEVETETMKRKEDETVFKISESSRGWGEGKSRGGGKNERMNGARQEKKKRNEKRNWQEISNVQFKGLYTKVYTLFCIYELITSWLEFVQILFIFCESTCRRRRDVNITSYTRR